MNRRARTVAAALLLGSAALAGCATELPQTPSWNTTLRLSVASDTTRIGEVAGSRPEFLRIADSLLTVDFTVRHGDAGRLMVGDRLHLRPEARSRRLELGELALADAELAAVELTAAALLGFSGRSPGPLPAISFSHDLPLEPPGLDRARMASGWIDVTLASDLPVGLRQVSVALIDGGVVQTRTEFADIDSGGVDTLSLSLRSRLLAPGMLLRVSGTAAPTETPVTVTTAQGLRLRSGTRDLRAAEYRGLAAGLPVRGVENLPLQTPGFELHEAEIAAGLLAATVTNHLEVDLRLEVELDGFRTSAGGRVLLSLPTLGPGESRRDTIDLAGHVFRPADPRRLALSYRGLAGPSDTVVTLQPSDSVGVRVEPVGEVLLASLEGVVERFVFRLPPQQVDLGFPEGLGNIDFRTVGMTAFVRSAAAVAGQLTLDVAGINRAGIEATMRTANPLSPGGRGVALDLRIEPQPAELKSFIENLPVNVRVTPTVTLGGDGAISRLRATDWANLDSVNFHTGAWFRLKGPTRIENGPDRRTVPAGGRDRIRDDFLRARLETTVTSAVPLRARVRVLLAHDPAQVYRSPGLVIPQQGAYEIAPVSVRGDTVVHIREVLLTREEALFLASQQGLYAGTLVEFDATPEEVALHENDYVAVTSLAFIDVEVNR